MKQWIMLVFGLALLPALLFVFYWKQMLVLSVLLLFLATSPFALLLIPVFSVIMFGTVITLSVLFVNYALQRKLIREMED